MINAQHFLNIITIVIIININPDQNVHLQTHYQLRKAVKMYKVLPLL